MKSYQEYFKSRLEEIATKKGLVVIEVRDYSNTGMWLFKKNGKTTNKVFYDFQSKYASVRTGNGNMYPGVRWNYGDDAGESKALGFCIYAH